VLPRGPSWLLQGNRMLLDRLVRIQSTSSRHAIKSPRQRSTAGGRIQVRGRTEQPVLLCGSGAWWQAMTHCHTCARVLPLCLL
jgi:hypothetical protein